jgi:hypothetical protein
MSFIKDNPYLKYSFRIAVVQMISTAQVFEFFFTRSDRFASSVAKHLPEDKKLIKTFDSCLSSLVKKKLQTSA